MATSSPAPPEPKIVNRWIQMCAGIVAMMAIANLQYAWTLFTKPLTSNLHATLAAVQITFAAFMALFLLKPLAKRTITQEDLIEQRAEAARKLAHA